MASRCTCGKLKDDGFTICKDCMSKTYVLDSKVDNRDQRISNLRKALSKALDRALDQHWNDIEDGILYAINEDDRLAKEGK